MNKNYLQEYHHKIQNGEIKICNKVEKVLEILDADIKSGKYWLDLKFANSCIDFIETFCHHSKTRNDLIKLELWQKAVTTAITGIKMLDGRRRFKEVLLILPRKQGKTLFAACLAKALTHLDKEYGGEIVCLAPKLGQAKGVFDAYYQICVSHPVFKKMIKKRKSDIYIPKYNTTVEMVAFDDKGMDGKNPSIAICDEVHIWRGEKGLRLYDAVISGTGARKQPLILTITTAGYYDDGIYDQLYLRADKFLKGDSEEERFLPFIYQLDNIDEWDNIDALKTCNPNYGVSINEDFLPAEIIKAKTSLSTRAEFLTKYCCIKQNSSVAWLDREELIKSFIDIDIEDFKRCYAIGGVDLSQRIDLTACSAIIKKNGIFHVFVHFFMPADRLEKATAEDHIPYDIFRQQGFLTLSGQHTVDYRDCLNWFKTLRKEHKIYFQKIGYDRWMATDFVAEMQKLGFHMDDVHQGTNLSPILTNFEGYLKDNKIKFHNNNLLKAHLLNVAVQICVETRKRKPVKIKPNARIDGFVSVIDAFTVLDKYHEQIGRFIENERG